MWTRDPGPATIKVWRRLWSLATCLGAVFDLPVQAEPLETLPPSAKQQSLLIKIDPKLGGRDGAWTDACNAIGKALMVKGGPWELGVFADYSCARGEHYLVGEKTASRHQWHLHLVKANAGAECVIVDGLTGVPPPHFSLSASKTLAKDLADPEISRLFALAVLDRLPMALQISARDLKMNGDGSAILRLKYFAKSAKRYKPLSKHPVPPNKIAIYGLDWDAARRQWRPQLVGIAARLDTKKLVATYAIEKNTIAKMGQQDLWGHYDPGTERQGAQLLQTAQEGRKATVVDSIVNAVLRTGSAGYIGIRYGLQMAKGNALLEKVSFFGLLAEVRAGPLGGARYYYDKLPEVKTREEASDGRTVDLSITWARHQLGYSFAFAPGYLVDLVTIAPKLGIWNFDANIDVARDGNRRVTATQHFGVVNAFGLGLELGLEWISDWYVIRPWAGIDGGFPVVPNSDNVSSLRGGVDGYWQVGTPIKIFSNQFRLALLAFGFGERVSLRSPKSEKALVAGGKAISYFEYKAFYAGGGLTVSW